MKRFIYLVQQPAAGPERLVFAPPVCEPPTGQAQTCAPGKVLRIHYDSIVEGGRTHPREKQLVSVVGAPT